VIVVGGHLEKRKAGGALKDKINRVEAENFESLTSNDANKKANDLTPF
jgi:hypothetical protein